MKPYICHSADSDREQWLKDRQRLLTASDIAAWCGANKYKSKQEVKDDKAGLTKPFEGNEHTERGKYWEPHIIKACSELGIGRVRTAGMLCESMRIPGIGATTDAIARDEFGDYHIVEIKCPTMRSYYMWKKGPPLMYQYQVVAQMLVCGYTSGYLVAGFIENNAIKELVMHKIELDPKKIHDILNAAQEWRSFYDTLKG